MATAFKLDEVPEIDWDEAERFDLSRDDIEAATDLQQLANWFNGLYRRSVEMKAFCEAYRETEIDDERWFRRLAGALAYCKIGMKWVERRILLLGGTPPYCPADPRGRQIHILQEKVAKLQRRVDEIEAEASK